MLADCDAAPFRTAVGLAKKTLDQGRGGVECVPIDRQVGVVSGSENEHLRDHRTGEGEPVVGGWLGRGGDKLPTGLAPVGLQDGAGLVELGIDTGPHQRLAQGLRQFVARGMEERAECVIEFIVGRASDR